SHGIAGLYIEDDEGGSLTNVVIRNNTCDKCSADISQGISMKMAENITLTNVLIHDNHPGVSLHLEGSSVRLINSTISGQTGSSLINVIRGRYGINPYVPSRLEISNSILWGNSPSPFNIQDESTVEVRNSIIQGSGGSDA